jgi:hypothetical protein
MDMSHRVRRGALALLVASAVLAVSGAPAGAETSAEGRDVVVGAATVTFPDFPSPGQSTTEAFLVAATSGPSGENARGLITFVSPHLERKVALATVTCLVVSGDRALVGGRFPRLVTYLGQDFRWFELIVEDNGPAPDTIGAAIYEDNQPAGFTPCQENPSNFAIRAGDYKVVDG